ncbi:MAG: RNB domain-containing ribonuclease [Candidatus Micrarchaeota archaeon]|nr:RNB domain-containing ribonuclease [Candidatus Micrarchaeota archaeon]
MHAERVQAATNGNGISSIPRAPTPLVLVKRNMPFPEEVLRDSESIALTRTLFAGRRRVKGVTIDKSISKDLDDAIWVEKLNKGRYRIDVSIADVTSVISRGSAIDNEALARSASLYYNTGSDPMIPHRLSENLLSLKEARLRPTITVSMTLSRNLDLEKVEIERTALRSLKRFTYDKVDAIVDGQTHSLGELFKVASVLAQGLMEKRRSEGAMAYFDLLSGIMTNEDGTIIGLDPHRRSVSKLIIQEFMILTNTAVASFLAEKGAYALYRNHKAIPPEPDVARILEELDKLSDATDSPSRLEIKMLRKRVANMFERAYNSPENVGHYALGIRPPNGYLRFTSPIRRYSDIINHRQIVAAITGDEVMTKGELEAISEQINIRELAVRNETNSILKMQRYANAHKALESDSPGNLVNGDFSRLIKLATRNGGMTDRIEAEIIKRLNTGKLNEIDLFTILFEPKAETGKWTRVREAAFGFLSQNPNMASYMYGIASQVFGWPKIDFETTISVSAKVNVDGQEFASRAVDNSGVPGIRHVAVLGILEQMLRP